MFHNHCCCKLAAYTRLCNHIGAAMQPSNVIQVLYLLLNDGRCYNSCFLATVSSVDSSNVRAMMASKELPAFAISPSICAAIQEKGDDWVPPREVLLGVGEPWESFSFDSRYDNPEEDGLLIRASQQYEVSLKSKEVTSELLSSSDSMAGSSKRWASPKSSKLVEGLRKSGVPQKKNRIKRNGHLACGGFLPPFASYRRRRVSSPTIGGFCCNAMWVNVVNPG